MTLTLVVALLAGLYAPITGAIAALPGAITVTVTADGGAATPISNVNFALERVDGGPWSSTVTESPAGVYTISLLAPGDYLVRAMHIDNAYVSEWYSDIPAWDEASALPVTVTDGGNVPIAMSLAPAGALFGEVVDEDTGDPLQGISVTAFDSSQNALGSATSDSAGAWMVEGLPADDVILGFQDPAGWYRGELYEDKYIFDEAKREPVEAGSERYIGIAKLEHVGTVSGRVTEDGTGIGAVDTWVLAYDESNTNVSLTVVDGFGNYRLPDIRPGTVWIKFLSSPSWNFLTEWYDDQPDFASATPVTVVAGVDTSGIDAVLSAPPANYELITISGTPRVGELLTGDIGAWSGTSPITYTYQWLRCSIGPGCTDIPGATTVTYVPVPADMGLLLVLEVTGTNAFGSTPARSLATDPVTDGGPPVPYAIVSVTGTPRVGSLLTGDNGGWTGADPKTYTYQWSRCPLVYPLCPDVAGATSITYTPVAADLGYGMVLRVTATNSFGSAFAYSVVTTLVTEVVVPFSDTGGNVHEAAIEEIRSLGITRGCNPPDNTEFCPEGNVTRGEMAAFFNRMLRLPPPDRDYFTDDESSIFEDDINRVATAGITRGCNPPTNDNFCPEDNVIRAQMAAFISRALSLPPADGDYFTDDDGSIFEDDINRLATAGITLGCNPPTNDNFCPDALVRRDQMATFLSRSIAFLLGWRSGP